MKIFSGTYYRSYRPPRNLHIANLAHATIGDVLLVAQYLEKETGIPFIPHDGLPPGLAANPDRDPSGESCFGTGDGIVQSGCRRSARLKRGFPFCKSFL